MLRGTKQTDGAADFGSEVDEQPLLVSASFQVVEDLRRLHVSKFAQGFEFQNDTSGR
jgi:hypothetical protein